jgi:Spy/CpxP family protein refolding chaperone
MTMQNYFMKFVISSCLVTAIGMVSFAGAQEKARAQVQSGGGFQPGAGLGGADYLYLPSHPILGSTQVQKEVNLSEEQLAKLKEIGKKFQQNGWKQQPQVDWTKLTEAERKAKTEEIRKDYDKWAAESKKLTEEARKKIDALLKPEQLAKIQDIELRQQGAPMLLYGYNNLLEKLNLTEEQKKKLGQHKEEMQKKMAEIQKEMSAIQDKTNRAALEVLTPEQISELKKLKKEGFRTLANPGQSKK